MSRDQLAAHVACLQRLRSWLDAEEVRAVRRTRTLQAEGCAESPESMTARSGKQSSKQSRTITERSEVCDDLPDVEAALTAGDVSAGHVDAIAVAARSLSDTARAEFNDLQADLVAEAARSGVDAFARSVKDLARSITARHQSGSDVDELETQRAASKLKRWVDKHTGMHHTHLALDPLRDAKLHSMVNAELARARAAAGNSRVPWDQMLVDAFVNTITGDTTDPTGSTSSGSGTRSGSGPTEVVAMERGRVDRVPEVTVLISYDQLIDMATGAGICETDNGVPLPAATVRRLCCDAEILPIVLNGAGEVLDAGRSARTATKPQRRALRAMHRTCAHPDCTIGFDTCRIHHITWWWEHHGPTNIDNLIPLCEQHHHHVHEGGWTLTMTPDRTATWHRPDGALHHQGTTIDRTPHQLAS
jgi:G3E family GTPase